MPEGYVRPPLVASEPRSRRVETWRFRLVALLLIAVAALVVVWLIRSLSPAEQQDPGIGDEGSVNALLVAHV